MKNLCWNVCCSLMSIVENITLFLAMEILILIFLFLISFLAWYTNYLSTWLLAFSVVVWVPSSFLGPTLWHLSTCFSISSLLIWRSLFNTFLGFDVISTILSSSLWLMPSIMMYGLLWYCCSSCTSWHSNALTFLVTLSLPESIWR